MKKQQHELAKSGENLAVRGLWRDRFKREAHVKIVEEPLPVGSAPAVGTIIEGERDQVQNTMFGLAEIAWDMGWRPKGLDLVLARVVKIYELPKD